MLDSKIRPFIDPPLNIIAGAIVKTRIINGNILTVLGLGFGLMACVLVASRHYDAAIILLLLNRLCDGLDGPLVRKRGEGSDFGGYLDIICDYIIYAGFPLAIAYGIGATESFAAASFLLFSIVMSAVSFLAYAVMAEKQGRQTKAQGKKSFFFSFGLLEGTETIIFLILMAVFHDYFEMIACIFGILCLLTALLRTITTYLQLK